MEVTDTAALNTQALKTAALADLFLDQLCHVSLVHHVRGRARLKANWNSISSLLASGRLPESGKLKSVLQQAPGIRAWRVNKKALSIVIEYDESIWPYRLWEELAGLANKPQMRSALHAELLAIWAAHSSNCGNGGICGCAKAFTQGAAQEADKEAMKESCCGTYNT